MVDQKKPKIDLKARLARPQGAAGAVAPVAPAPMPQGMGGSRPPPGPAMVVGQPVGSSVRPVGVPPPFQAAPAAADPFGGVAAAQVASMRPMAAAPTTIKVELDDAMVRAQSRSGKKVAFLALVTAVAGGAFGFVWGGQVADQKGVTRAIEGAQDLVSEIDKSQAKIKELNDKIEGAVKSLKEKKYPEAFGNELGGLSIPFGSDKLAGKNIGRFDPKTLQLLFRYTNQVEALNDRKDGLKNLFIGQKQAVIEALGASDNPKVSYAVYVQKGPKGPVGFLAPINPADRFGAKDAWPPKLKISNGQSLVEADRYNAGDVIGSDKKMVAVPLDPEAVNASFPTDVLLRITGELVKTGAILSGTTSATGDEEPGIIKNGDLLLTQLRNIGKK